MELAQRRRGNRREVVALSHLAGGKGSLSLEKTAMHRGAAYLLPLGEITGGGVNSAGPSC